MAISLGSWAPPLAAVFRWKAILPIIKPLRMAADAPARAIEAADRTFRLWPVASLCLIALILMWIALALWAQ